MIKHDRLTTLLLSLLLVACDSSGGGSSTGTDTTPPPGSDPPAGAGSTPFRFDVPIGFPTPRQQPDNPLTLEKIELGRYLFYDRRMSVNAETACASCHLPALAFTDGRVVAIGATGQAHPRNSMTLTNAV